MFSTQISKILSRNRHSKSSFLGCYPADRIPRRLEAGPFPHSMVVNMDPHGCAGSHWCALYVNSPSSVEYYDSLADWPPPSPHIADYLSQFNSLHKSDITMQSDTSASCGKHVIYFLVRRSQGIPFENLLEQLLACKSNPDVIVGSFVHKLMDQHTTPSSASFSCAIT
jgi:hypothetical protein